MKATLLILAAVLAIASAHCPNGCSGHGTCGAADVCSCFAGFQGGDCSERQCPYETAWVATPYDNRGAHYLAECANKGLCNRETGDCECFDGYEGSACQRQTCPNDCSGHGTCESVEDLAISNNFYKTVDPYHYASISNFKDPTYTLWDEGMSAACVCDAGYQGADCSERMCPRGDDPLTTTGSLMSQIVVLAQDNAAGTHPAGTFTLTYHDLYGGSYTTAPITIDTGGANEAAQLVNTATNVENALKALPMKALADVTVAAFTHDNTATNINYFVDKHRTELYPSVVSQGGVDCANAGVAAYVDFCIKITFPSAPGTTGRQHLLECDDTGKSIGATNYNANGMTVGKCSVREAVTVNSVFANVLSYVESDECSKRGKCDRETGQCECFAGFKGLACETQEALV